MQTVHPPKQYYPGTLAVAGVSTGALPNIGLKFPAGYKWFGKDVWRLEVQGTLGANDVQVKLYETRNGQDGLAPIAVRGSITPTNGYQRPLTCCAQTTNGGYIVTVFKGLSGGGAGTPQQLYVSQKTDSSRVVGFAGASFKLQVDFVEA